MNDITLTAKLASGDIVYLSHVHWQTYADYVEKDNLGGSAGYFISRERAGNFEVLAKAASLDAARILFGMLVAGQKT